MLTESRIIPSTPTKPYLKWVWLWLWVLDQGTQWTAKHFNLKNAECSGDTTVRGVRHTSNFGAGSSDMGNVDTLNLVDNQLCETFAGPNFEQYQLITAEKKKRARPRLALHTERQQPTTTRKKYQKCDPFSSFSSETFSTTTNFSLPSNQASKMNGRDAQTGCRQQHKQYLATAATEDAQTAGNAPDCAKNFRGENFDTKLKNDIFPTNVSTDEVFPRAVEKSTPRMGTSDTNRMGGTYSQYPVGLAA